MDTGQIPDPGLQPKMPESTLAEQRAAQITAKMISYSGVSTAELAARRCYDLDHKTEKFVNWQYLDKLLNVNKHESVFEHIMFTFDLAMPRTVLQELSRHRIISASVKSTRYSLKKLVKILEAKNEQDILDCLIDNSCLSTAEATRYIPVLDYVIAQNEANTMKEKVEALKNVLPEGWFSSGIYTINFRSLRNLLELRLNASALTDFQTLSKEIWEVLPDGIKYLLRDTYETNVGRKAKVKLVDEYTIDDYQEIQLHNVKDEVTYERS
jgi:thymidylate synthase (FAD)